MSVNRDLLPPYPWQSAGNVVKDGVGRTVCVVFAQRYASEVARFIAESIESDTELREEIARLEGVIGERDTAIDKLEDEVTDLKSELEDHR